MNWLQQHRLAVWLALRRLAAAPLNSLLALLAIGIALALPAAGQMLLGNLGQLGRHLTPNAQISIFTEVTADKQAIREIDRRLRTTPEIKAVRFVAREETLARMKTSEGLADAIDALPGNPFPDAFIIKPTDERPEAMERLAMELRQWPKVEYVQLDSAWARRLDAMFRLARTGVLLLAALLGIGLVAITFNTIRSQVLAQRTEIEVSRLLGATDAYIRRPFLYYGCLQSLLGGLLAWLIVAAIALWLRQPIGELASLYSLEFVLHPLSMIDSAALLGAATALGWLGAALSLQQDLRD